MEDYSTNISKNILSEYLKLEQVPKEARIPLAGANS